MQLPVFNIMNL
ncbi:hypothetical protein CGLO_10124 [Colletotrichum gloeosporioides Cg-14]|uniref:Uncharacterized protein n=1 Tax=Colletotrichum gloeosporioides (strain Cg-14) TaxID=1237896 RepID=T0KED8_COLGC|nr:hypothetical protein CGLO_10124 [Colletotrichum gloeosporioides Cg-14]